MEKRAVVLAECAICSCKREWITSHLFFYRDYTSYASSTHCPSCKRDTNHKMSVSPDGVLPVYEDVNE